MTQSAFYPSWVDTQLYPFDSKFLSLKAGDMHYVDEGKGKTLLFVHGTPTWSFLYRDFIKELSKDYRCIALDHLGFGLSPKVDSVEATPQWHAQNLVAFIEALDLHDITLVVHDFGGPIGLAAGLKHIDRISKIVLFNTWLWSTKEEKSAQKIDRTINSWLGRFLYLTMNISPKLLLKKGFHDKKYLSQKVHQQYIRPFPDRSSRIPLLHLAQALVGSSDWYQEQWEKLDSLAEKEWLILWGTQDSFITTKYLQRWINRLPNAQVHELNCGHFVQEEKTQDAIQAIKNFLMHSMENQQ